MIVTDERLLRKLGIESTDVLPEEVAELRYRLELELKISGENGFPGIGLAAPQIGIAKKMAIIRIPHFNIDLVNCKIEKGYDPAFFDNEGCLSFPGILERTLRFQEILVINNLVKPYKFIATGLPAVAIQHELEHLIGKTFKDGK